MSRKTNISWLSSDTLDAIAQEYTTGKDWKKKFPYSHLRRIAKTRNNDDFYSAHSPAKIINLLKKQAQSAQSAIDTAIACEIANGNDYIIEGYHIIPSFAQKMIAKYGKQNVRAVFLTKFDATKFAVDVHKSTTPNDWLIVLTKKPETFIKVGKMISKYSEYFEKEAKSFGLQIFNMDKNFDEQIENAIKFLIKI